MFPELDDTRASSAEHGGVRGFQCSAKQQSIILGPTNMDGIYTFWDPKTVCEASGGGFVGVDPEGSGHINLTVPPSDQICSKTRGGQWGQPGPQMRIFSVDDEFLTDNSIATRITMIIAVIIAKF